MKYKLVPLTPTERMLNYVYASSSDVARSNYRAMIGCAPQPHVAPITDAEAGALYKQATSRGDFARAVERETLRRLGLCITDDARGRAGIVDDTDPGAKGEAR